MTIWAISWDDTGLEAVVDLTELECRETFERLSTGYSPDQVMGMLRMLQLRCHLNSHRNTEIWLVESSDEIDEAFLWRQFDLNADGFKSLVRATGIKQF